MQPQRHTQAVSALAFGDTAKGAQAKKLLEEFERQWKSGAAEGAAEFLARHPEMSSDRSFVMDVVYEDYCQRRDARQPLDVDAFCGRFPGLSTSIRRLIAVDGYLADHAELTEDLAPANWPQVGDLFQKFVLDRQLGSGAFGKVFLAFDTALG